VARDPFVPNYFTGKRAAKEMPTTRKMKKNLGASSFVRFWLVRMWLVRISVLPFYGTSKWTLSDRIEHFGKSDESFFPLFSKKLTRTNSFRTNCFRTVLPWRRGAVDIASVSRTRRPGFESRQGIRFLGKRGSAVVYKIDLMCLVCLLKWRN
jgi:hypothetical protein